MTGPGNGAQPAEERPPSRIVLEFGAPGSSEVSIRLEGLVNAGQLYLAAWLLDAYAHQVHGQGVTGPARLVIPASGGQLGPLGGAHG